MEIKLTEGSARHLAALQDAVHQANRRFLEAAAVLALQDGAAGDFAGAGLEQRPDGVYLVLVPEASPNGAPVPAQAGTR